MTGPAATGPRCALTGPVLALVVGLGSGACLPPGPPDGGPRDDAGVPAVPERSRCTRSYTAFPAPVGNLEDAELVETSGVVASWTTPGVLWMHNDSGDETRLFATGTDGRALGRLSIAGAEAEDAEDLAIALCPGSLEPCLWLADTGDNGAARDEVALFVVTEPEVPATGLGEASASVHWRYPFTYDEGPVDVEAVVVEPAGDRVWLLEKVDGDRARVFLLEGPFEHGVPGLAVKVADFASPGVATVALGRMITGADLHPSRRQLVVRVYTGVFEYRFAAGQDLADLDAVEPLLVTLGPLTEPQGEAVAYDEEGYGLWTVSEDREGMPGQPLHHYDCE